MKTKTLAACMLAAITLSLLSCRWFSKKDKPASLIGKWKVTAIIDSSHGLHFSDGFNADSTNAIFTFNADSILSFTTLKEPAADTGIYHTDAGIHAIFVKGKPGSRVDTFVVSILNDTLLKVVKDSIHVSLKRF